MRRFFEGLRAFFSPRNKKKKIAFYSFLVFDVMLNKENHPISLLLPNILMKRMREREKEKKEREML